MYKNKDSLFSFMKWHIKLLVVLARQACTGLNTFATCLDMNISNSKQAKKLVHQLKNRTRFKQFTFPEKERTNEKRRLSFFFFIVKLFLWYVRNEGSPSTGTFCILVFRSCRVSLLYKKRTTHEL